MEEAEVRLVRVEVVALEEGDRRVQLGDLPCDGHAVVDEPLFHLVDDRADVERDRAVVEFHRAAAAAGQGLVDGAVDAAVGFLPDGGEGAGRGDGLGLVVDEGAHRVLQRTAQRAQRLLQQRALVGCRAGEEVGEVEVVHDGRGDPVGDGVLDVAVGGERRDRRDIAVGVAHGVRRPRGHRRERREHAPQDDEHHGEQRTRPVPWAPLRLQYGDPRPQPFQFSGAVVRHPLLLRRCRCRCRCRRRHRRP